MTLEEAKKEIKKLIDRYDNDAHKYDDLHINLLNSHARSSVYKKYTESKSTRNGLQKALHIIEQIEEKEK